MAYIDQLEKLLLRLDSVDSDGLKQVKQQRREIVKAVEQELDRVEAWRVARWAESQSQRDSAKSDEETAEGTGSESKEEESSV